MIESEKPDFFRVIATLRAMYPNEYNMSELVPLAYWTACRGSTLSVVKEAVTALVKSSEWLRHMPPAPVIAEQARIIGRRRHRSARVEQPSVFPEHTATVEAKAWAEKAKAKVDQYMHEGEKRGPATIRAILELIR